MTGIRFALLREACLLCGLVIPLAANADVVVSGDATQNMSCTAGVCTPLSEDAVLNLTDLENLLAAGNVTISTTGQGVEAENVDIDAEFGWSNGSGLVIDAFDSIRVNSAVAISGPGALSVTTQEGDNSGTFSFGPQGSVSFAETSSALSINGTPYALFNSLPSLAKAIAGNPSGAFALAQNYDASQDGKYRVSAIGTTFEGNLNGLGNTITGLRIIQGGEKKEYGLFSELDTPSSVASLRIAHATIHTTEWSGAGMIAGLSYGTVFNSEVGGKIYAKRASYGGYGGALGGNTGLVEDVSSSVDINLGPGKVEEANVGDLVGANEGTVDSAFATGAIVVTGFAPSALIGGLLGLNNGYTSNCYATGSVAAKNDSEPEIVGGLIGVNSINVSFCYSTGAPSAAGSGSYVGGLIGYDQSAKLGGTVTDTYWDTRTSGISNPAQGAGNLSNDPGIKARTTAQLRSKLPKGFDSSIWAETAGTNKGLPYLIANPPTK